MRAESRILGIDLGGTKIAAGLLSFPEGKPLAQRLLPTESARGGRAVLDDVLLLATQLASESGEPIQAIGLGLCELVDRGGRVVSENCLPWIGWPVSEELSRLAPAILEADVRAAALAEAHFGAGRGRGSFLYVTIGTGISCCLMIEGRPWLGANGLTGTMASSPLSLNCSACDQRHSLTLEDISSGPALISRFNEAGGQARKGQDVLASASAGHPAAVRVVESAASTLGSQIGLLINTLDPEAVVLGGGLGLSEGLFREQLVASTREHIWSPLHREIPILSARMGTDAGWIGAACAAWNRFVVGEGPH